MMYKYDLDERVTVKYPRSKLYPNGRELDGVVCRRGSFPDKRYTVLFDDDTADCLLPECWLHPIKQLELS